MLDKDATTFRETLAVLHPGEVGQMVAVVLLSKKARQIRDLNRPEIARMPLDDRVVVVREMRASFYLLKDLAQRFSSEEMALLWQRFNPLDARLRTKTEHPTPGFQGGPSAYLSNEMPANFGVDEFITSWDENEN